MTTSRSARPSPLEGLGTPALAAGVVAAGTCFAAGTSDWVPWLGVGAGLLAVVLGFLGARRAMDDPSRNGGAALAGLVLGLIGLGVGVWFVVQSFAGSGGFGDGLTLDQCMGQASGQQEQRMCASQHLDEYRARNPGAQNM